MTTVDIRTAQQQLVELTEAAAHGEDVIITRSDGSAFRLVLLPSGTPKFGSAAGQITIRADFDDPLPEFEAYYA
jgi:antitoxin (DNA-binding transcriptional repressor) of toxin-antitoxin stability system